MNIPLLRQIQERIKAEPHNFRMDEWHCGTAHCIGGWAQTLAPSKTDLPLLFSAWDAGRCLCLDYPSWLYLFYVAYWPESFREAHQSWTLFPPSPESLTKQAQIACDRIDHFIATEGRE